MADLIDRDKLIDYIMESDPDWCVNPIRPIFDFINGMPSVEAVEVVRCKDCYHYDAVTRRCFMSFLGGYEPTDFCSYGERADG